ESQVPLKRQNVSGGIFAPAITYNKKNKTFYMITTNVGAGNFVVKTKDPSKGWSEPIYLPKIDGIDPSLCFDKKGNGWIVHNAPVMGKAAYEGQRAIRLLRYDVKGDSTVGAPIEIVRGGTHVEKQPIWIEGPHLYQIGKYYYLMCAEGGTGAWHSEVIFRAKKPQGPWEECPDNPILTQRTGVDPNRENPVTSTGHADLVQAKDGSWWAVFLGCRPYEDDYYNTGRDTYLLPVTWKNGWPTILEKGKVLPNVVDKPGLQPLAKGETQYSGNFSYEDDFNTPKLNMRWMFLRNPSTTFYETGNGLTIHPLNCDISEKESPSAIFCRQQHTNFSAETSLTFEPKSDKDVAGFTLLQNEENNFVFGKTLLDGKPAVVLTRTEKNKVTIASALLNDEESKQALRLKMVGNGRYYDFYYATGKNPYQLLARGVDAINLSTNRSGGFIGACIGLYGSSKK
ncbi:MAG: glycoside hydrolase family 43 protein, partial [Prevotella sp.]